MGSPPRSLSASPPLPNSDPDDPLQAISEQVVPSRAPIAPEPEVSLQINGLETPLRLAVDAGPGCGGIAWPSGEVLARYLAYKHSRGGSYLRHKRVIELGSGTGLVGLVAGLLDSSCESWITDQAPLLPLMKANTVLNFPFAPSPNPSDAGTDGPVTKCPIHVVELDWGTTLPPEMDKDWDMVLAADCVYFEPAFPLLVDTLCQLAPIGAKREVLFCWKKRRKADTRFFKLLHKHFTSHPVEDDKPGEREKYEREGVRLMRLIRIK